MIWIVTVACFVKYEGIRPRAAEAGVHRMCLEIALAVLMLARGTVNRRAASIQQSDIELAHH